MLKKLILALFVTFLLTNTASAQIFTIQHSNLIDATYNGKITILNAVTTGTADITFTQIPTRAGCTIHVDWSAGTHAGQVTIYNPSDGTVTSPTQLAVITWAAANAGDSVYIAGVLGKLRATVTTTVTGGTVTVRAVCT